MFIIHGYQAHTNSHWFEWLATQMKSYHYQTEIVYLPNTHNPDLDAWDTAIQNNLKIIWIAIQLLLHIVWELFLF